LLLPFGIFSPFWYIVPWKIWQPRATLDWRIVWDGGIIKWYKWTVPLSAFGSVTWSQSYIFLSKEKNIRKTRYAVCCVVTHDRRIGSWGQFF
jgi:hypothetical protein